MEEQLKKQGKERKTHISYDLWEMYVRIARRYGSTPWRVYYLGHGGRCRSLKDIQILEALQRQGVISHIYPW